MEKPGMLRLVYEMKVSRYWFYCGGKSAYHETSREQTMNYNAARIQRPACFSYDPAELKLTDTPKVVH